VFFYTVGLQRMKRASNALAAFLRSLLTADCLNLDDGARTVGSLRASHTLFRATAYKREMKQIMCRFRSERPEFRSIATRVFSGMHRKLSMIETVVISASCRTINARKWSLR